VFFGQPLPPFTPFIVKMVEQPAKEISVADVLMGSIGITGIFLVGAVVFGFLLGAAFIMFRRWQDSRDQDSPVDETFQLTQPPRPRT
jgi:hypothetical protein